MNLSVFTIGVFVLLVLTGIKRIFGKREIIRRYALMLDGALFGVCFLILAIHFYQKRENAGLLAVGMGATAIGKYLYDKSKIGEEN
ncbi:MAG: hypothetical protein ACXWDO_00070 [Bacteroidia bacterium]